MDGRQVKREAKFRAGLILESVVQGGWSMDQGVIDTYGQEAADQIADEIETIARRLIRDSRLGAQ
ncbi:hypothetical protein ACFW2V_12730 [Streptomyces sp. NPDC058947]|uniref:hypothetical protein n=1 Tax=Streptomyces sp. NPDC058947 TaxID=3346675 RepID=UPI0036780CE6